MAYISLYRKYRSQTFDDVVGQDHVVRTIRNAIKAGRIAQGYLFCGSRGTGKTTVARLIAKALNCMAGDGPTPDPCNKCEACTSITEGNAVDVIEMDAASNRGVDDVDALRQGVKYPPMRLRYKVYIIDEAHQLSPQAKDAFLKTLEEPPPHAVFILATTEAGKIPITIRSRCQQFDFRRGSESDVRQRLEHVTKSENINIEPAAAELIARSANGSYRDGLSLLEQVIAYTEDSISADDVYTVLGTVEQDALLELGHIVIAGDTSGGFALADKLLHEGRDVQEILRSAAGYFRDLLALKVGADTRHQDDPKWAEKVDALSRERIMSIIDVFASSEKDLKWNDQHRLALEMAILKAMSSPAQQQAQPVTIPAAAPVTAAPAPVTRSAPAPKPAPAAEGSAREEPTPADVGKPNAAESKPAESKPESPATPDETQTPEQPVAEEKRDAAPEQAAEPDVPGPEVAEPVAAASEPVDEPEEFDDDVSSGDEESLTKVRMRWENVLRHLRNTKQGSVAAMVVSAAPVNLVDGTLTIGFSKGYGGFHVMRVNQDSSRLSDAIEAVLGLKLKVVAVELGDGEQSRSRSAGQSQGESTQGSLLDGKSKPKDEGLAQKLADKLNGEVLDDDDSPFESAKEESTKE